MKKAFVLIGILMLVAVVGLGSVACKKKTEPAPTEPTGSTVQEQPGTTPATAPPAAPATAGVAPEVYWNIQLARQEAMKQYLAETLAIYTKHSGATPEARNDIMALEKGHQERMQQILTSNGLNSTADLMPSEPGRQEALQSRQAYMQEHPELREKFMAMSQEMKDLKDKITAFTASSSGAQPGSTAPAPPPEPPTEQPAAPAPVPVTPPPAPPAEQPAPPPAPPAQP